MTKNNTTRNIIIALVSVALVGALIVYLVKSNNERAERKAEQKVEQEAEQERLEVLEEQIAKDKEGSYYNYMRGLENLVDSNDYNDIVRVAELSDYYLYNMNSSEKIGYFQRTQKGNDYLEKLDEEATKRLNNALHSLYNNGVEYRHYDEMGDSTDNPDNVHEENLAFFEKEKQRFDKRERNQLIQELIDEKKEQNPRLGMTKEQVEASSWGKPKEVNRTVSEYSSTEQWVYGRGQYLYFTDGILTSFQD